MTRTFLDEPVAVEDLRQILRAARAASTAGNRRMQRYLVIRERARIEALRPFAPGILRVPPALIVLANDVELAREAHVQFERDRSVWIDVGTALANMMLAAQALGLGSCPATSFSQAAVAEVLDFPQTLVPELLLQVGRPAPQATRRAAPPARPTLEESTSWERLGQPDAG